MYNQKQDFTFFSTVIINHFNIMLYISFAKFSKK